MQCDPSGPAEAGPSLPGPQSQFTEEASDSADRGRWVGIDRRDPGSWGDGQMPSCEEERTWLLYPQVHCPLPCPKQLIFNISIPWLIFKHRSFPDKFFRGAFAVGLGGSGLSWQRTSLSKRAAHPGRRPAPPGGRDSRPEAHVPGGRATPREEGAGGSGLRESQLSGLCVPNPKLQVLQKIWKHRKGVRGAGAFLLPQVHIRNLDPS